MPIFKLVLVITFASVLIKSAPIKLIIVSLLDQTIVTLRGKLRCVRCTDINEYNADVMIPLNRLQC